MPTFNTFESFVTNLYNERTAPCFLFFSESQQHNPKLNTLPGALQSVTYLFLQHFVSRLPGALEVHHTLQLLRTTILKREKQGTYSNNMPQHWDGEEYQLIVNPPWPPSARMPDATLCDRGASIKLKMIYFTTVLRSPIIDGSSLRIVAPTAKAIRNVKANTGTRSRGTGALQVCPNTVGYMRLGKMGRRARTARSWQREERERESG
jgi:hypothetical protein